ncbi:hypothetical protein [Pseudomonas chlororaphis]|uniref:hypothetical protein n=1 Tax=Pseudomonas chlororaphis TaxID=587753 RepID=UPI001267FA38|nr:hypothetical protein [Pseudomonas chlororaphis]
MDFPQQVCGGGLWFAAATNEKGKGARHKQGMHGNFRVESPGGKKKWRYAIDLPQPTKAEIHALQGEP